jgi:pyruvate/2-oxoglutarate/acetoin dehydrogenase E1 component
VIFFEHKVLYTMEGDVPDEPYVVPLGEAEIVREGEDVTIVAIGRMVSMAEQAAASLADDGIEVEIVDPRTTSPLDEETIYESVENTGRLVVVDESNPRCSMASDIVSLVSQNCFEHLKAAPRMVTAPHTPTPFSGALEDLYVPDPEKVANAVREVAGAGARA